jgi:hypothetical protein
MRVAGCTSITKAVFDRGLRFLSAFFILTLLLSFAFKEISLLQMHQSMPGAPAEGSTLRDTEARRQLALCGPNSLYMFLALHDLPVDGRVIEKYIPSHREGMSFVELREACNALGLGAQVRRCSIDDLCDLSDLPAIAYLTGPSHYVLVIDITSHSVTFLDGTTGAKETVNRTWLNRFWSGYVLIANPGRFNSGFLLAIVITIGCLLALVCSKRQPT